MDELKIKSFSGDYHVFFDTAFSYRNIVSLGDIVIADRVVAELYKQELKEILCNNTTIVIEATEAQKSYEGIIPIMEEVVSKGFHKDNSLIAIGGGITQDIVAFMASILYRGVAWKLIPTTLLAQCDSCIGSKTSINFMNYKNQVGGFYPPREIYVSLSFLDTLEETEIKSGLGEMLHYYVVGGESDFSFFEENFELAYSDKAIMKKLIRRSLEIKKQYVEIDEFDRNERQIFNYGHSFGHAIEAVTEYGIPHGIAVSIGIDIANFIAVRMNLMDDSLRQRIKAVAKCFWDMKKLGMIDMKNYLSALGRDKKNKGNRLGIILCSNLGMLDKYYVDADESFCRMLNDWCDENNITWE